MNLSTQEITRALSDGLLSFPVTDMNKEGQFVEDGFKKRISWFLDQQVSAVFVAGGTGEFFSLSKAEYQQIVQASAEIVKGKIPLLSSIGRSIPEAVEFSGIAESSRVDALLLMPPYLTQAPQEGVYQYAKTILQQTSLPVIFYNLAIGILSSQ